MTYPLTSILWPDEGFVQVYAPDSTRIALISIQFLRSGGVLTWDYVHFAVSCCINETDFVLEPRERDSPRIDFNAIPTSCTLLCKLKSIYLCFNIPPFKALSDPYILFSIWQQSYFSARSATSLPPQGP